MPRFLTILLIIGLFTLFIDLIGRTITSSKPKETSVHKQPVPLNIKPPKNKYVRSVPYDLERVVDKDWHVKFDAFAPFFYWEPKNETDSILVKYISAEKIIEYADIAVTKVRNGVETNPQEKYYEAFLGNTGKYVALVTKGFNPDILYIKNLDTLELTTYSMTRNRIMNVTLLQKGTWSANDAYFYYMVYNENGSETELWAINTYARTNLKVYSSNSPIFVYGWKDSETILFHDRKIPDEKSITIKSLNLNNGSVTNVGSCSEPWLSECYNTTRVNLVKDLIYFSRNNQPGIYAYNFTNQLVKPLFEADTGMERSSSSILNVSPRGRYMYMNLHTNSDASSSKSGLYVISLENDFWRQISQNLNLDVEMYDLNENVSLLNSYPDNSYYIHKTGDILIEKVNVPASMKDFKSIKVLVE